MVISAIAGAITFVFTALLTIAGVGAAFILIPVFIALGIDVHIAMATALLLNSIAMIFASYRFIKNKLVMWKVAIPILIVATALSPLGAYVSVGLNRQVCCGFSSFSGFLGHATVGNISAPLLGLTAVGSALGAVVGAWLMTEKLKLIFKQDQIRTGWGENDSCSKPLSWLN